MPPRAVVEAALTEKVPEVEVRPLPAAAPPIAEAVPAGRSVEAMTREV